MKILFLSLLISSVSFAGRPVFQDLSRSQLIERSDFVFSGWPSAQPALGKCPHEFGRWWVHKVYKGDPSLKGKVISIAESNYRLFAEYEGKMLPSFQAWRYKTGQIDREQSTSFLFTIKQNDGCFELSAQGAQEHRFKEAEMDAMFAGPKDCSVNLRGFEMKADTMPTDCAADADCKLVYAHPNSCGRPFIWNKTAESKIDDDFKFLQARARTACASEWSKQPACSPVVFPVRCRNQKCEAGASSPEVAVKINFKKGKMRGSCAPHDAASEMITVTDGKSDYPALSINWWGDEKNPKPSVGGGVFTISAKSAGIENGFTASFCTSQGHCRGLNNIEIKLTWKKGESTGTLHFSFMTDLDEPYSGSVSVELDANSGRVLCG